MWQNVFELSLGPEADRQSVKFLVERCDEANARATAWLKENT